MEAIVEVQLKCYWILETNLEVKKNKGKHRCIISWVLRIEWLIAYLGNRYLQWDGSRPPAIPQFLNSSVVSLGDTAVCIGSYINTNSTPWQTVLQIFIVLFPYWHINLVFSSTCHCSKKLGAFKWDTRWQNQWVHKKAAYQSVIVFRLTSGLLIPQTTLRRDDSLEGHTGLGESCYIWLQLMRVKG